MVAILHFNNLDTYKCTIDDDDCDDFCMAWDTKSDHGFEMLSNAWIKPCDVLWIEFPEED